MTKNLNPEQKLIASYIEGKLVEYVTKRGIAMPFYTNGSKITEEAKELRNALVAYLAQPNEKNLASLKDEVADVVITAAVAARQASFTVEDALDTKIAKDANRGPKKTAEPPVSQIPEFIRRVANKEFDVSSMFDLAQSELSRFRGNKAGFREEAAAAETGPATNERFKPDPRAPEPQHRFKVGENVTSLSVNAFSGTVVSLFQKTSGKMYAVVEDNNGELHIFKETQLELAAKTVSGNPWVEVVDSVKINITEG